MTEPLFTRAELRALPPTDLADLLRLAEGDTPIAAAVTLGLDPKSPEDCRAVEAAVLAIIDQDEAYSPPIGADPAGVRSDLTPAVPEGPDRSAALAEQGLTDLGAVQADPTGARELALMMDRSAATGEPFLAGTFALYAAPTGDVVMVTEGIGEGVRRSVVPKRWVRTALGLMSGEGAGGMKGRILGKLFHG
jgi:hypothetical protein